MKGKIRIGVVDDHPLYRDGVVSALGTEADIEVVAQGETAVDAIQILHDHAPDILLIDLSITGGGANALARISLRCPSTRILVLTAVDDENEVRNALRKGARGYLLKETSRYELVNAVRMISKGQNYVSPSFAAQLIMLRGAEDNDRPVPLNQFPELSEREKKILMLILQGLSNRLIGEELGLTEKTVKGYLTGMLEKLQVRNRLEAAIMAAERMSEGRALPN